VKVGLTTFGCDHGRSGIGRYLYSLLRATVTISQKPVFSVHGSPEDDAAFEITQRGGHFDPHSIAGGAMSEILWHQGRLPAIARRQNWDVAFFPAANRRLSAQLGCPKVGVVHDLSPCHVTGKYDGARQFYVRKVIPRLVRGLQRVITVSESTRLDVARFAGLPMERIQVVPNAVDHSHYQPLGRGRSRGRVATTYAQDRPYLLYVSRLEHPGKNHVRLIRAFERLLARNSLPHELIFAGPDWTRAECIHQAAAASEVSSRIRFLGRVSERMLPSLYCAADALVFPSLYEGFGLPLLEAMACGTPVICSNTSSLPEVANRAALLFDPVDPDDIARCMRRVLQDRDLARELRLRGRARSQEFTWERTARETFRVLSEAAA